jgi:probable addiction module antidote protein
MMAAETRPFDPSEYLDSDEGVQAYLEDAFASGDPSEITDALGVVAKAVGMSSLAQSTGLTRAALYKALTREGNPEFATIVKVAEALGFKLSPVRVPEHA